MHSGQGKATCKYRFMCRSCLQVISANLHNKEEERSLGLGDGKLNRLKDI